MLKRMRGLASLPVEKRRTIASLGGKSAHAQGKAHTWNRIEAKAAGRKGGLNKGKKIRDLMKVTIFEVWHFSTPEQISEGYLHTDKAIFRWLNSRDNYMKVA